MKRALILILVFSMVFSLVSAQGEVVGRLEATVCCEETNSGLFCQDVPEADCDPDSRVFPTACESTSFCNPGFCFDSSEGTCLGNVPQSVCNANNGTWDETKPAQCELGCCVLGDQASFVTLTRCKKLSGFLGLQTNYNSNIGSEAACILTAAAEERGACVYNKDFELTCEVTTRSACTASNILGVGSSSEETAAIGNPDLGLVEAPVVVNNSEEVLASPEEGEVEFVAGKLCSADVLGTVCGPSEDTICLPGREEVYFVDTCGNPANIYDASKINDKNYWSDIKDRSEACNPNNGNANSQTCGNCNYLQGTFCRESNSDTARATYGDNICQSLNCVDGNGVERKHGESWCGFDEDVDFTPRNTGLNGVSEREAGAIVDAVTNKVNNKISSVIGQAVSDFGSGKDVSNSFLSASGGDVGSRYFRSSCNNGEIVVESCADFRQEECIENAVETVSGEFVEAACRVNRWQDCTAQRTKFDCVNTDVRDCKWMDGIGYTLMVSFANGSSGGQASLQAASQEKKNFDSEGRDVGACVPENPPGLKFWKGEEAAGICSQANAVCPVTYEKGLLDSDWKCVKNCDCLPGGKLEAQRAQLCMALGDCGPKINIAGAKGRGKGYKITQEKINNKDSGGSGGIF